MSFPLVTPRDFALRHKLAVIRDTILPAQMQAAILRQCPGVSIDELENAIDAYRFANVLMPALPANERKASLERVSTLASELRGAIETLAPTERAALVDGRGRRIKVVGALRAIAALAHKAAEGIQPSAGRPLTRKAYVVRDVARELKRCRLDVDASSKGSLVFIVSELFSLVDDPPSDVRSLVRNTLAKIDFETMDFRHVSPP